MATTPATVLKIPMGNKVPGSERVVIDVQNRVIFTQSLRLVSQEKLQARQIAVKHQKNHHRQGPDRNLKLPKAGNLFPPPSVLVLSTGLQRTVSWSSLFRQPLTSHLDKEIRQIGG